MSSVRRACRVVAVVALLLLGAPSAGAQELPLQQGAARLDVRSLSGVLGPGDDLEVTVRVRNPGGAVVDDLRVVATVHRRTRSRLDYQLAVDRGEAGAVLHAFSEVLEPLPPQRFREVRLVQTAAALGFVRPEEQLGVYPLQLRLLADDEVVDELTTSVVLAPEEVDNPLRTALLLPLDAPPALLPDGGYERGSLLDGLQSGGRLRDLVDASLGRAPRPLTMAASGLLLDQVAELAGGTARVEGTVPGVDPWPRRATRFLAAARSLAALDEVEVISLSYGPGDLVALTRHGAAAEMQRHIHGGRTTPAEVLDTAVRGDVLWPPADLDRVALRTVADAAVDTLILSEDTLAIARDRDLPYSPSPHRRLHRGEGPALRALVPDPWIEEALAAGTIARGAPLATQRILGETAAVFFERPYAGEPRGLLLAPPRDWEPPTGMSGMLAEQLDRAPWTAAVTVTELADQVPADPDPVRLRYPGAAHAELDGQAVEAIVAAREAVEAVDRVVDEGPTSAERFDRQLLAAGSVHARPPRSGRARALTEAVARSVQALFEAITLVESPPVLLSSIEGQVPVTLRNDAPVPLRVQVRLETQRYTFADGPVSDPVTLPPESTRTLAFRARALAPGGVHQIGVVVEDVEGGRALTTGTVVVRSTAVSTTALVITAAAVVFLVAWWLRELARRRRGRPTADATSAAGAATDDRRRTVPSASTGRRR